MKILVTGADGYIGRALVRRLVAYARALGDRALERLGVAPAEAVAFEDSAAGIRSALDAGLPVLATRSQYTEGHPLDGAFSAVSDLGEPERPHRHLAGVAWPGGVVTLAGLRDWHAGAG